MKKLLIVSLVSLFSVVAHANSMNIFVATSSTSPAECEARVADIAQALAGRPVVVTADQQAASDTEGNGDATNTYFEPGDCNARLTSTGKAEVVIRTIKFHGACTAAEMEDSRLNDAAYANAYEDFYSNCAIDSVSFR